MIRLLSASVAVANRAGTIIRDVLHSGELGVVHKVNTQNCLCNPLNMACCFRDTMIHRRRRTAGLRGV